MRTRLTVLFALIMMISAKSQVEQLIISDFDRIVLLIKTDNTQALSQLVNYPLKRNNPLPDITTSKEFIADYPVLFDTAFKKKLDQYKESDVLFRAGSYGLIGGPFAGDMWIDQNGKILSLNYSSAAERERQQRMTDSIKKLMNPEVNSFKANIKVCSSDKHLVRIDATDKGIRYVSWRNGDKISDRPEVILNDGVISFEGTQGGMVWTFKDGDWVYKVNEVDLCENATDCGIFLTILHNGVEQEKERCTETK
jgi:hypothetical protein